LDNAKEVISEFHIIIRMLSGDNPNHGVSKTTAHVGIGKLKGVFEAKTNVERDMSGFVTDQGQDHNGRKVTCITEKAERSKLSLSRTI